jgi:hypothetical protein
MSSLRGGRAFDAVAEDAEGRIVAAAATGALAGAVSPPPPPPTAIGAGAGKLRRTSMGGGGVAVSKFRCTGATPA